MKEHWRDPGYWRWLWRTRVQRMAKPAIAVTIIAGMGLAGYITANYLGKTHEVSLITSEHLVTLVRKSPGGVTTEVVTETDIRIRPGETITDSALQTVVRDGETVVIRRPGQTLTETVGGKVVTREVTETALRTNTVDRPTTTTVKETVAGPQVTVTGPGQTTTETRDVPGPERTATETETETETETRTETETQTETETETETETVTVTEPKKP